MHKKHKKRLTQEVKSTIYAQTQTLTTQTHTDIKKRIKRLKDFNLMTASFIFSLPFLTFNRSRKSNSWINTIHQIRR